MELGEPRFSAPYVKKALDRRQHAFVLRFFLFVVALISDGARRTRYSISPKSHYFPSVSVENRERYLRRRVVRGRCAVCVCVCV